MKRLHLNQRRIRMKFMRRKELEKTIGLSRSYIYDQMDKGLFPKQVKIGLRAVAWKEEDILNWMNSKK